MPSNWFDLALKKPKVWFFLKVTNGVYLCDTTACRFSALLKSRRDLMYCQLMV